MADQLFNPEVVAEKKTGLVYKVSSGSGGRKADYEAVQVFREEDGTYKISYTTPASVNTIDEQIPKARNAIEQARGISESRINQGMPGTGKITNPKIDLDVLPEE